MAEQTIITPIKSVGQMQKHTITNTDKEVANFDPGSMKTLEQDFTPQAMPVRLKIVVCGYT